MKQVSSLFGHRSVSHCPLFFLPLALPPHNRVFTFRVRWRCDPPCSLFPVFFVWLKLDKVSGTPLDLVWPFFFLKYYSPPFLECGFPLPSPHFIPLFVKTLEPPFFPLVFFRFLPLSSHGFSLKPLLVALCLSYPFCALNSLKSRASHR